MSGQVKVHPSADFDRRLGRRSNRATMVAIVASLLIVVPGLAAGAGTAHRRLSSLQQGMNFYRGKTVTLIVPSMPGATMDQLGRDVTPFMGQFLHATFTIENVPQGNSIAGQDDLAASPANGLTIGEGNPPAEVLDTLTNVPSINFNLAREAFIGTMPPADNVFIASSSSPVTDFAQMRKAASIPYIATGQGITDILMRSVNAIFGLHFHIILGYANIPALIQGFVRGDGDMLNTALATVGPLIAGGKARPILQTTTPTPGLAYANYLTGVPTLARAARQFPPRGQRARAMLTTLEAINALSGILLMAPSATPSAQVAALRAAFVWTMRNPSLRQMLLSQGNIPDGILTGPEAKQAYLTIEHYGEVLKPVLLAS